MKFSLVEAAAEVNGVNIDGRRMGKSFTFKQWMNVCVIVVPPNMPQSHIEQLHKVMKNIAPGPAMITTYPLRFFVIRPTFVVVLHSFLYRVAFKVMSLFKRRVV